MQAVTEKTADNFEDYTFPLHSVDLRSRELDEHPFVPEMMRASNFWSLSDRTNAAGLSPIHFYDLLYSICCFPDHMSVDAITVRKWEARFMTKNKLLSSVHYSRELVIHWRPVALTRTWASRPRPSPRTRDIKVKFFTGLHRTPYIIFYRYCCVSVSIFAYFSFSSVNYMLSVYE